MREALLTSVAWTLAAGQPPDQDQLSMVPQASWPASARARQRGVLFEQPADFRGGEIRIEHQPGALGHPRLVGLTLRGRNRRCGDPARRWPGATGLPGGALPEHDGFALVGQADGRRASAGAMPAAQGLRHDCRDGLPDFLGVVLDPARLRIVLRQFVGGTAETPAGRVVDDGAVLVVP